MIRLLVAAFLLGFLLSHCKKEPVIPYSPVPTDTIPSVDTSHVIGLQQGAVLKNGVEWLADVVAYYFGQGSKAKFQLRMKRVQGDGEFRESFNVGDIPGKPGKYIITYHQTLAEYNDGAPDASFGMFNYDAGIGSFYPDRTRNDNFIEVLRYDTISNEVEGRFQVFMGLDNAPSTEPGVPDSVFLTDGKFYLKIQQ